MNLKFCNFRKKLLDYCREVYLEFFQQEDDFEKLQKKAEDAGKSYNAADHQDAMFKRQHKLFGNIEFIGELFTSHLLRNDTAKLILENLLDKNSFTDDTVEAAIRFIEKIGQTIEEKLKTSKADAKNKITEEDYQGILAKFDSIWKTSEAKEDGKRTVSVRI